MCETRGRYRESMVAHPHPNRAVRISYLAMGFACLGLGLVGIFVPLMPTTVFILLAGFFFAWRLRREETGPNAHGLETITTRSEAK